MLWQGVQLEAEPRDLDIYADRTRISEIHDALQLFSTDTTVDSETGIYRSLLSHYNISGIPVELVGSLIVDRGTAVYEVEVTHFMSDYAQAVQINGLVVRIMPLIHELVFNVLRDRPDRYIAIADVISKDVYTHIPVWRQLLKRNQIGEPYLGAIQTILPELVREGGA